MFEIIHEDEESQARVGKLRTSHGVVETPAFLPVATKASVKTLSSEELLEIGTQALIANAFVLYLRPGVEVIKEAGGLHRFMNWDNTIFTDSGGFQMLKKDFLSKISKRGVTFKSPFDDTRHLFTPEKCIEVQEELRSDIAMVLDDCPPYGSDYEYVKESLKRTIDWAKRCKKTHNKEGQALFAIIQGGVFLDLRKKGVEALVRGDFAGYGIGGLSIGEPKEVMQEIIGYIIPMMSKEKPRYLMGVGSPIELLESISRGIDIFDSAFPTRNARHNTVYTKAGRFNITKGKFANDFSPIEPECKCHVCKNYSRAYVSYLLKVYETLGMRLATMHNLSFLQDFMKDTREAILNGEFNEFKKGFTERYS